MVHTQKILLSLVLASFCAVVLKVLWYRRRNGHPLPPGPTPLPIVGNVLDLPRKQLGREFLELSNKYGNVMYLDVLGQPIVVLSSYQAAYDLLDKRSAIYSDRPRSIMVNLVGYDWLFILMNYGAEWRQHRRAFHSQFSSDAIGNYASIQTKVVQELLRNLSQSPHELKKYLNFAFASTVMRIIYGIELEEQNDRYFNMVERMARVGEEIAIPGRFLVEAFPALRHLPAWFPGGKFKEWAAQAKYDNTAAMNTLFDAAKLAMERGSIKDCMITRWLSGKPAVGDDGEHTDSEDLYKSVAAATYVAGAETVNSMTEAFFLAMALFPAVQKKAQGELDIVVGQGRLPEFSDRDSLPYVNAIIKELLRWHVATPISVPHRVSSDDVYEGLFIPEGATIIANAWAMSRDANIYPDPEQFDPSRFLSDGQLDVEGKDPADYVFGFGRRICPGRHFAESSLFILFASLLWSFEIGPPVDEYGSPLRIQYTATTGSAVSHTVVHDYTIKARSPQAERLILESSMVVS